MTGGVRSASGQRGAAVGDERDAAPRAVVPRAPAACGRPRPPRPGAPSARAGRRSPPRARRRRRTRRPSAAGCRRSRDRTAARARGTCSRAPVGRSARRYTPIARAGCGSVETRASSSSSTVSPATSRCTGSMPALARRLDEILALRGEEPRLVAVLALPEQLADELERLVVARRDHSRQSSPLPWESTRATTLRRSRPDAQLELERPRRRPRSCSQRRTETQASGRPSAPAASSASPSCRAASSGR